MRAFSAVVLVLVSAVALGVSAQPLRHTQVTACTADTIGLDAPQANSSAGVILGEGLVQTFAAHDTLVEWLRVWRVAAEDHDWYIGMHLYITETNVNGGPDPGRIVLDGPTLVIPDGDGVHPIEFKWAFDPPLALPHQGEYAFYLFPDPCRAYFDVLATNQRPEDDGSLWLTDRGVCVLHPQIGFDHFPQGDLVFQIGLCRDVGTPARRPTWGQLKLLYR